MGKSSDNSQKPKKDRDFTSAIGLGTIIVTAIYFGFALYAICYFIDRGEIFNALKSSDDFDKSVGIIKDIGLLALGVIAFPLTIWRSMIADGQRAAALEQLKRADAQLRETENNNIAKLLVDGTKLLGKDTSEAEKMAGIACLANIIEAKNKFSSQAFAIIKEFLFSVSNVVEEQKFRETSKRSIDENKPTILLALRALNKYAFEKNIKVDMVKFIICCSSRNFNEIYSQFHNVAYSKGVFVAKIINLNDTSFDECMFINCSMTFKKAENYGYHNTLGNQFYSCLFTGSGDLPFQFQQDTKADSDTYYDESCSFTQDALTTFQGIGVFPRRKLTTNG